MNIPSCSLLDQISILFLNESRFWTHYLSYSVEKYNSDQSVEWQHLFKVILTKKHQLLSRYKNRLILRFRYDFAFQGFVCGKSWCMAWNHSKVSRTTTSSARSRQASDYRCPLVVRPRSTTSSARVGHTNRRGDQTSQKSKVTSGEWS